MSIVDKLQAVLNTLEGVEVKGRDNLDRVLGCIQTVEAVIHVLKTPAEADAQEDVDG